MESFQFRRFVEGVQYVPINYDNTLQSVKKIIPLSEPFYLIIDNSFCLHLSSIDPNSTVTSGSFYPMPSYAILINPKVLYTIEPEILYRKVFKRIMLPEIRDEMLESENKPDFNAACAFRVKKIDDHRVIIHFNKKVPLLLLDLRTPNDIKIIHNTTGALQIYRAPGTSFIFLCQRKEEKQAFLHNVNLNKTKRLAFKIPEPDKKDPSHFYYHFCCVKEGVIILNTDTNIQFLNYKSNKLIKVIPSFIFSKVDVSYSKSLLVFSSAHDIVCIYQFKNGSISWEKKLCVNEKVGWARKLKFITEDRIVLKSSDHFTFFRIHDSEFISEGETTFPDPSWTKNPEFIDKSYDSERRDVKNKFFLSWNDTFFLMTRYTSYDRQRGIQQIFFCKLAHNESNKLFIKSREIYREKKDPIEFVSLSPDKRTGYLLTESLRLFEVDLFTFKIFCFANLNCLSPYLSYYVDDKRKANYVHYFQSLGKGNFLLGITREKGDYRGRSCLRGLIFNSNRNSLNEVSRDLIIAIAPRIDTAIALTHEGDKSKDISLIEIGAIGNRTIQVMNKDNICTNKLFHVSGDLYFVSDEFHGKLKMYENDFKDSKEIVLSSIFPELAKREKENSEKYYFSNTSFKVKEIKLISEDIYMIIAGDWGESLSVTLMKKDLPIKHLAIMKGFSDFGFRISNEMFFLNWYREGFLQLKSTDFFKDVSLEKINDRQQLESYRKYRMYDIKPNTFRYLEPFKVAIGYERQHNKNAICIFRKYNVKPNMINILRRVLGKQYSKQTIKMVYLALGLRKFDVKQY